MDVASISAAVAAISVVVGVIFAIFQMRDAAKTRHTGLIIQLNPALKVTMSEVIEYISKIWNLKFKDYKEYLENYGDPLSDKALHTITGYYDGRARFFIFGLKLNLPHFFASKCINVEQIYGKIY